MQQIQAWLREYGLNETEIAVYLCILQNPGCRVAEIQTQTSLVRTTLYYALANLKSEGLVSENTQNNVRTYRAGDISSLEDTLNTSIEHQRQQLDDLHDLKSVFEELSTHPSPQESYVARYEGVASVKQAIEQAFRCTSKRWYVIASRDNFLYHTSKQYKKYYLDERKRRGIIAKTLWEPTDSFKTPSVEDMFYRNPRRLPETFRGTFNALIILYDNTTLIIDSYEQKTAHAVHNQTSTQLLRLMHSSLWQAAKKV